MVIWASAAFAGFESVRKLIEHGHTEHVAAGGSLVAWGILQTPSHQEPKYERFPSAGQEHSPKVDGQGH